MMIQSTAAASQLDAGRTMTPHDKVPVPLTELARGESGLLCETRLDREDASLLRAMGVCLGARVRVSRVGDPIVVAITSGRARTCRCAAGGGCRIGLARELATRVYVVKGSHS